MIEEIPLLLIFHDRVVVGPAFCGRLLHDDTLKLERSHGTVSHGIGECLCGVAYPRKGVIILPLALEYKRSLLKPIGQGLHLFGSSVEFHHIVFQSCHPHPHASPVDICFAILGVDEHTGVNAMQSFYRLAHRTEWALRTEGNSYAHAKAPSLATRCSREIEIIAAVLFHTVGCPHGIRVFLHPWHLVLSDNRSMVSPVGEVVRRENMIVLHREPFLLRFHRTNDIM